MTTTPALDGRDRQSEDIYTLTRLGLNGQTPSIAAFARAMVFRYRKKDPELAARLYELLRETNNLGSILREEPTNAD